MGDPESGVSSEQAAKMAKQRWEAKGQVASWGCFWFPIWKSNIERAISFNQKLVVYFFEKQVGKGKIPWGDLSKDSSNPWDGVGLGGSQKAEVAYLDMMR